MKAAAFAVLLGAASACAASTPPARSDGVNATEADGVSEVTDGPTVQFPYTVYNDVGAKGACGPDGWTPPYRTIYDTQPDASEWCNRFCLQSGKYEQSWPQPTGTDPPSQLTVDLMAKQVTWTRTVGGKVWKLTYQIAKTDQP